MPLGTFSAEVLLQGPSADSAKAEITFDVLWSPGGPNGTALGAGNDHAQAIANRVDFAWRPHVLALLNASWRYKGVRVKQWDGFGHAEFHGEVNASIVGLQTWSALPPGMCVMVRKNVDVQFAGRRPTRYFFPCIWEGAVDDGGNILQSDLTNIDSKFNLARTNMELPASAVSGDACQMASRSSRTAGVNAVVFGVAHLDTDPTIRFLRRRGR
jgi:hypothetical protein